MTVSPTIIWHICKNKIAFSAHVTSHVVPVSLVGILIVEAVRSAPVISMSQFRSLERLDLFAPTLIHIFCRLILQTNPLSESIQLLLVVNVLKLLRVSDF